MQEVKSGYSIDPIVADKIIEFIYKSTAMNTIVCDADGTIVAAKVRSRIGSVHTAAQRMLREGRPDAKVTAAEAEASGGVIKAGVNLPIRYKGKTIGSFGIAGDPERTEPIALIAAGMVALELDGQEVARKLLAHATHLDESISQVLGMVERANAGQAKVAQLMGEILEHIGNSMLDIDETHKVVDAIRSIASKTHMLAINAAIEAAHALQHGQTFAVVAREVRDLSKESAQSTQTISKAQSHLQLSMNTVVANSRVLAGCSQDQTQVTAAIGEMVVGLKSVSADLIDMARSARDAGDQSR